MTSPLLKAACLTLASVATLAFVMPAQAAITLGFMQRVVDTPSAGFVQDTTDGTFNQTLSGTTSSASQNSLIDLAALPQFSGSGAASINLPGSAGQLEAQSLFTAQFTIPVGESYSYALSGNLASAGTGYIDATTFSLRNALSPFNTIVDFDPTGAFSTSGVLGAGTYRVSVQTRLLQDFEEDASATGSWQFEMTLRPVTSSAVPEPSSLTLFGLGLIGLCAGRIRRRSR